MKQNNKLKDFHPYFKYSIKNGEEECMVRTYINIKTGEEFTVFVDETTKPTGRSFKRVTESKTNKNYTYDYDKQTKTFWKEQEK